LRVVFGVVFFIAVFGAASLPGQIPAGYYASAEGKRGEALRSALYNIIKGHNALSYNGAKDKLWSVVDNRGGFVQCIYSGRTSTGLTADSGGMNAEHTWPQSRGAEGTAKADLHHLFVTDAGWNSTRGSLRFSNVANPTSTSPIGAKVNSSVGFEPPDEYKGDVARVIFYFHIRYQIALVENPALGGSNNSSSDDPMGILSHLIAWHEADAVSSFEQTRNERIYGIQNNRNPFIDRPEFVAALFETAPPAPAVVAATDPAAPRDDESATLTAQIVSATPVSAATVQGFWRVGTSGAFATVAMTLQSGTTSNGTWRASTAIPVQAVGTVVQFHAQASDTAGATARDPATGEKQYTVTLPAPPVVAVVTDPAQPRYDSVTHLSASIQSERAIAASGVVASWRVGSSGAFTQVAMTRASGSDLSGTWRTASPIPAQPGGTIVEYFVQATNVRGQTTRQPAAGQSSYTSFEPGLPAINAILLPAAPTEGATIQIQASISAEAQISPSTVRAYYTLTPPGGAEQSATLSLVSGTAANGTWRLPTPIPAQSAGTVLRYRVEASDLLGRAARFPAVGNAEATVAAAPTELDLAGWKLADTGSTNVFTFPAGAKIGANGFVIVSRSVDKPAFETTWGALPAGVNFFNGSSSGANGMVINGAEVWELRNASNQVVDGPSATAGLTAQNGAVVRASLTTNQWSRITDTEATPGAGDFVLSAAGVRVTEFGDPSTGFAEAFVEIFYDAGSAAPVPDPAEILEYLLNGDPPAPTGFDMNSDTTVDCADLVAAVNSQL